MYKLSQSLLSENRYLNYLSKLLTAAEIELFHEDSIEPNRVAFDGAVTLFGDIHGKRVAILWTDFRVAGGSFSKANSQRVQNFIHLAQKSQTPLVIIFNSLGVRFMEGRTVFDDAFKIIADLYEFRKNNLLITVGLGKVLGISALFFAQGHIRIAKEEETQLNLTGPEVHKRFFGKIDADFSQFTVAEHQFQINSLIHEILPTEESIYTSVKQTIGFLVSDSFAINNQSKASDYSTEVEQGSRVLLASEDEKLEHLKSQLGDSVIELFNQRSPIVRVFVGHIHGTKVGYLLNPPGHAQNMLTVDSIDKCMAAMDLFKTLNLPIVSILDSPGGDPRKKESDKDAIMKMIQLTHEMIAYPYPKMGIIMGRCFGGAPMFVFPKIYGGKKSVAVRGAQFGVMHKSIISELLSSAPRLKEAWLKVSATEVPELEDLIACGTLDKVIEKDDIKKEIAAFLMLEEAIDLRLEGQLGRIDHESK